MSCFSKFHFHQSAATHLTFGSDAYVSGDRRIRPKVDGLLDADVSQSVFSEDGASIEVGGHEATEARERLGFIGNTRTLLII